MQFKDKYKSIINQQEYFQNINIFACDNHARKFHIFSAGLLNYLPAIPFVKHEEIYKGILFHKHLSTIEQDCIQALKTCQIENFFSRQSYNAEKQACHHLYVSPRFL